MVLHPGFLVVAQKLHEAATASASDESRSKLLGVLSTLFRESAEINLSEAGARNSKRDMADIQSIHDAATNLGAVCAMKESAAAEPKGVRLVESAMTLEPIKIAEAKADYEIKLIAPGKGSSAFYPKEVLQRDGPKVFTAGTHVYVNHPTLAEEAARPEGDVKNLAGVLSMDAFWSESHAKGPGLYGRMKVFADHGQMVEEKAAHVGMSIRASGVAEAGVLREGVPVLKSLTGAESVDVVTRAGAGGMILTEAAKPATESQEGAAVDMDEAAIKKLVESAIVAATAPLKERALRGDAMVAAGRTLSTVTLPDLAKQKVIDSVLRESIPTKDGVLDETKLADLVMAEAKREGAYIASITGGGRIVGMGPSPVPAREVDPVKIAEAKATREAEFADEVSIFESLGMNKTQAEFAAKGRAA